MTNTGGFYEYEKAILNLCFRINANDRRTCTGKGTDSQLLS